jgi:hypothetical protein
MRDHQRGASIAADSGEFGFRNGDASGWSSFDLRVTVDPIFADGAANLRSRAAPSARIEPHILFLTEHWPLST